LFDFILAPGNFPFAVALGLMLGIALLEGTMTLLGAGLSQAIDSLIPDSFGDVDLDADVDMDIDADVDADLDMDSGIDHVSGSGADVGHAELDHVAPGSASALSRLLGWLCVGKVPVLILLVAFLTVFGLAGLALQTIVHGVTGAMLPGSLASIPALIVAVPSVRVIGTGLSKLIPKDETAAVKADSFVGRVARITLGEATKGQAAEAKLKDAHGQTHYVMVEPDGEEEVFEAGTQVLLIKKNGPRFLAIRNTNPALVDE